MKKYLHKKKAVYFILITMALLFCLIIHQISFAQSIKSSNISLHNKLLYIKGNNIWASDTNGKQCHQLTNTGDISNFAIASDLSKMVLVRNYKKLFIMDVITGNKKFVADVETDMSSPSISPDNNKIIITSRSKRKFDTSKYTNETVRHIWLFDLKKKSNIDLTENSEKPCSAPQWSPDGKQISFTCSSATKKGWYIYTILDPAEINKQKKEVAPGFHSMWLDNKTIMIDNINMFGSERVMVISDLENSKIVKEIRFNPGMGTFQFSFEPPNNLYYEDARENPDLDIGRLSISTLKQDIIIRDARSPIYCK
jgi:dipeptidyl aminopeptidase/acylaminoacyl peptidase